MQSIFTLGVLMLISSAPSLYKPASASTQEQSATPSDKAVVYIYRYKQFEGYIAEPSVYCDGIELARMDNGRYFKVIIDPGRHTFRSTDKQSGIEKDLKAGEEYYIRVEITTGLFKQRGRVVSMTNEQGAYETKKLKPLDASKVRDRNRVVILDSRQATPKN